ncbi:membrane protein [Marivirga lumbricoides]|uniref:Membrane protein n=2 Tax=Marivirga lumbricoides TaxID=1046115 RepID=A0ABQ1MCF7_9BACT|nr:membrane protein [Marivirga lumbricoides]
MRRYDLDWLRVIVFGLLIFYHVGMFFVPWGWHIKNNVLYEDLTWPMRFLNQWRLPILFVISGMGSFYALNKRNGFQFMGERIKRLLIPLIFGMAVIVPVQVYAERVYKGEFQGGYFDFWPQLAFIGVYPEGNISWHHLWFLPYLLVFSLILTPIFVYLKRNPEAAFIKFTNRIIAKPLGLYLFLLPLYLIESLVEPFFPSTHDLLNDWFNFSNFITLFFFGFLLMTVKDTFWKVVQQRRRAYLYCGLIGFTLMIGLRIIWEDSVLIHFIEAGFMVFNFWSWILAIFGYAATYLNKPGKRLSYCNEAVYPFYILHQSVTIAIGLYLYDLNWGFWAKASILVIGTFGGCWILYELVIRRVRVFRLLFGLKSEKKTKLPQQPGKISTIT